jgi:hypothetical protein
VRLDAADCKSLQQMPDFFLHFGFPLILCFGRFHMMGDRERGKMRIEFDTNLAAACRAFVGLP